MKDAGMSDDGRLRNIITDHCLLLDAKRYRAYADLFADNGRLILSGVAEVEGREAIHDWICAHAIPPGRHLSLNVRVEVNGDQATGNSNVLFVTPENVLTFVGAYDVRFVKVGGAWKIAEWRAGRAA